MSAQADILVVDDSPEALLIIKKVLSHEGYTVRTAENGRTARDAVVASPPDLILLDVFMPDANGLDICRDLQANEETRRIPIILMSAFADSDNWAEGLRLGAADYVKKPFQPVELAMRVRTHLALRRADVSLVEQANALRQNLERAERSRRALLSAIEDQKRTECMLRESERRLRDLAANLPGAVYQFVHRPDGSLYFAFVSEGGARLVGRPLEDLYDADHLFEYIHADDLPDMMGSIRESEQTMSRWRYEFRIKTASGEQKWIQGTSNPTRDVDGSVVWNGVFLDITERKRIEDVQRSLQAQLLQAQKMESIGRLAGGIAHDFNNLLAVVLGYSEMLLGEDGGFEEDDPAREALLEIFTAGERARSLTQQLLAFSRQQVLEMSRLDLNDIVSDFRKMLARLIGEDIALVTSLAREPVEIDADRSQIEQIVLNLAVNARDAMPRGGRLTIVCANTHIEESESFGQERVLSGDYAELKVKDTGSGMSREVLNHVFEPFFTTKGAGCGTGLGLATVHGIVKQHNGYIEIESALGEGTTFRILLPRAVRAADSSQRPSRPDRESPRGGDERILVVEDDVGVRKLTVHLLSAFGYEVHEAAELKDALDVISTRAPLDLLLTDVIMPRHSGAEVYQCLAKQQPGLKVLYMSGYIDDLIAEQGILTPGTLLLRKPFTNDALARKIREALDT